ncbi:hypothetical protein [Paraburkholderia fungorum]|uniref:Uncharacterized protein n=1 Tax=Paraburkholderia fungorum TaxID=134537 RepID=A0A420FT35_9BURK|nr:hypothetical protein [Paraburkholderia fungorum]RKF36130.1 hypothetical protein BCY88_36660 [Paraburkholderia fungorum]
MSLFASLSSLAQKATLIILTTTEGAQLRMNVTPSVAFPLCRLCMSMPPKVLADVARKIPEPA